MFGDSLAGGFVSGGGGLGKAVDAAVDVGIDALVVVAGRIEDAERFLRSGGVIEIDERLPVDFLIQDGELFPEFVGIERAHGLSVMLGK